MCRVLHQQLGQELPRELDRGDALVEAKGRGGRITHQHFLIATVGVPAEVRDMFYFGFCHNIGTNY